MKLPVTMRQDHAAGDKLFVDYAGDTAGARIFEIIGIRCCDVVREGRPPCICMARGASRGAFSRGVRQRP
ncbi:hypothetical protein BMJ30_13160 [Sinorhizobium medicae]|nr:hypothetical protein BMJ30_13160 [Sinorhizobium medicae]